MLSPSHHPSPRLLACLMLTAVLTACADSPPVAPPPGSAVAPVASKGTPAGSVRVRLDRSLRWRDSARTAHADRLTRAGDQAGSEQFRQLVARLDEFEPTEEKIALARAARPDGSVQLSAASEEAADTKNEWATLSLQGGSVYIGSGMDFRGSYGKISAIAHVWPLNPSGSLRAFDQPLGGSKQLGLVFTYVPMNKEWSFDLPVDCGYAIHATVIFKAALGDVRNENDIAYSEASKSTNIGYQPGCTRYCPPSGGGDTGGGLPPQDQSQPIRGDGSITANGASATTSSSCPGTGDGGTGGDPGSGGGGGPIWTICIYLDHYDSNGGYLYSEPLGCYQHEA